jgi:uncharacterized protein (DUF952 family)
MKKIVFKIARAADWEIALAQGHWRGSADDLRDGYIHLSSAGQLRGTLEKHFRGESDLVLIAFEELALAPALKWESSRGGELFPHLYGTLPTSLKLWEQALVPGPHGIPILENGLDVERSL